MEKGNVGRNGEFVFPGQMHMEDYEEVKIMDEEGRKKLAEQIIEQIEQNQKKHKRNDNSGVIRLVVVNMDEFKEQKKNKAEPGCLDADFRRMLRRDAPREKNYSIVDILDAIEHFSDAKNVLKFLEETHFPSMDVMRQALDGEIGEAMIFFITTFMYSMLAWLKQNK